MSAHGHGEELLTEVKTDRSASGPCASAAGDPAFKALGTLLP